MNKVCLVGRITADPVLRKTNSGISVANFTLACNKIKKKDEEQQADFIKCQAWKGSADFLSKYVRMGALLEVEGRIQTRHYEDQSNHIVNITEVVCESVHVLAQAREKNNEQMGKQSQVNYGNYENYTYDNDNDSDNDIASDVLNLEPDDLPF